MKSYSIKIVAYANYPIKTRKGVAASSFKQAAGKALTEFWNDQGKDKLLLKRRKKIKTINLSIQTT